MPRRTPGYYHLEMWNQLPLDIRCSDNVAFLKSRVKKFVSDF